MFQKECGAKSGFLLTLSFFVFYALVVTGCATLGDIESANERTQQSLNAFKKESRQNQSDLKKQMKALRKEIRQLQNTDLEFDKDTDKIVKENQKLRASLLAVTATLQGFLAAERKRYEDGLRWIDSANKSMGGVPAKSPAAKPMPQFPGAPPTPSPTQAAGQQASPKAPSSSPTAPQAAATTAPSSSPAAEAPKGGTAPPPSPPSGDPTASAAASTSQAAAAPAAAAAAATVAVANPKDLDESELPTINIQEVKIDPPKVQRKSKFTVTVKYDIEAEPDGPKLQYQEQVVLLKGTLSIQNLKEHMVRDPGTIFYSRTIEVPEDAPTGVYTIKATVTMGPVRKSKIKTFVVK